MICAREHKTTREQARAVEPPLGGSPSTPPALSSRGLRPAAASTRSTRTHTATAEPSDIEARTPPIALAMSRARASPPRAAVGRRARPAPVGPAPRGIPTPTAGFKVHVPAPSSDARESWIRSPHGHQADRACTLGRMAAYGLGYYRYDMDWRGVEYRPAPTTGLNQDAIVTELALHHVSYLPSWVTRPLLERWPEAAPAPRLVRPPRDGREWPPLPVPDPRGQALRPPGTFWRRIRSCRTTRSEPGRSGTSPACPHIGSHAQRRRLHRASEVAPSRRSSSGPGRHRCDGRAALVLDWDLRPPTSTGLDVSARRGALLRRAGLSCLRTQGERCHSAGHRTSAT